jgi:type VI secretion system secreted protein Hcp
MAVDMFIKIDDIKGESTDEKHKDLIEVVSFSWGMSQTGSSSVGTGSGTGKVDVQNLSFTKFIDTASPALVKMCCKGKHFNLATLYIRKAGDKPVEYLRIELYNGLIAQVSVGGSGGDDRFTENVSLNFASFKYYYTPQVKGAAGAEIPAAWNIAKNSETVP